MSLARVCGRRHGFGADHCLFRAAQRDDERGYVMNCPRPRLAIMLQLRYRLPQLWSRPRLRARRVVENAMAPHRAYAGLKSRRGHRECGLAPGQPSPAFRDDSTKTGELLRLVASVMLKATTDSSPAHCNDMSSTTKVS